MHHLRRFTLAILLSTLSLYTLNAQNNATKEERTSPPPKSMTQEEAMKKIDTIEADLLATLEQDTPKETPKESLKETKVAKKSSKKKRR